MTVWRVTGGCWCRPWCRTRCSPFGRVCQRCECKPLPRDLLRWFRDREDQDA